MKDKVLVFSREIDLQIDPTSAFYALQLEKSASCLRESVVEGIPGRFTFLYFVPFRTFRIRRGVLRAEQNNKVTLFKGNPVRALKNCLENFSGRNRLLPTGTSSAVGYLGYDCAQHLENIKPRSTSESREDDACFIIFRNVLVFDRLKRGVTLVTHLYRSEKVPPEKTLDAIAKKLASSRQKEPKQKKQKKQKIKKSFDYSTFASAVKKIKTHILDGDIFQCVLSNRMVVPFRSSAFDLYCRLRQINPSPYLYYFRSDPDQCLLGASPETLVKVQDRHLETWPIAGTRPRGKTPRLDEKNRRNLLGSVKERAEHVMLVDLGRNDLGRVSSIGTVNVKKLMEVKKFSHVMHLVSEVESTLAPSFNAWDALLACFPAGTLTGAPKIRAMQIISELENTARGAYGGAFVVYDFSGDLDSAIIIRSCMVKDGLANFQAGAGIVSDSQAAREFREIEDKAGAVRKALGADVP